MANKLNHSLYIKLAIYKYGWQLPASIIIFSITAFLYLLTARTIEHNLIIIDETRRLINKLDTTPPPQKNNNQDIVLFNKFNNTIINHKSLAEIARLIDEKSILNHLVTDVIDYNISPWPDSNIQAYRISLPIYGKYVETRKFINDILVSTPAAALEHIEFSRDNKNTETIKTTLQFIVFTRPDDSQ